MNDGTAPERIYGLVLAGGASRRMGRDKALLRLGGCSLFDRVCARLAPQCHGIVVSRHAGDADGLAVTFAIVADHGSQRAGPLAGLLAGLDWVARTDPEAGYVVSTAVDTPFLPTDLVRRLVAARGDSQDAVACAASGGRRHPVAALWPVALRDELRSAMADAGGRRVGTFLDRHAPAIVHWPTDPVDPFFNVNTPEDAATAEAMLDRMDRC